MNLKNIFQIYTLLICLISTVILIISTAMLLNAFTDLLIPQYKHYSSLLQYESNSTYLRYQSSHKTSKEVSALERLPAPQLEEKRLGEKKEFLKTQKGRAIENMISTIQWALIAFIFFFIHWRLYKRSKTSK